MTQAYSVLSLSHGSLYWELLKMKLDYIWPLWRLNHLNQKCDVLTLVKLAIPWCFSNCPWQQLVFNFTPVVYLSHSYIVLLFFNSAEVMQAPMEHHLELSRACWDDAHACFLVPGLGDRAPRAGICCTFTVHISRYSFILAMFKWWN